MKCKICGFEIVEGQENCPGCGTSIEELKQAGNIEMEQKDEVVVTDTTSVSSDTQDTTSKVEEEKEVVVESEVPTPIVDDSVKVESTPEVISIETEKIVSTVEDVQSEVASEPTIVDLNENVIEEQPIVEEVTGDVTPVIDTNIGVEETSVVEPQVDEIPVVEAPSTDEPIIAAPVVEAPSTDAPTVETSVVEAPSTDTPTVETSVVEEAKEEGVAIENVTEQVTNNEEMASLDDTKPKKKSKAVIIIAVIIVIVAIIVGLGAYVHFVLGSGYNVFSRTVKVASGNLTKNIDNSKKSSTTSTIVKFLYSGNEDLDFLNKTRFNFETKVDATTGNADAYIGLIYDEERLELDAILNGKDLYLSSKNLYDKALKINLDTDEFNEMFESYKDSISHTEEMKRIINSINDHIVAGLKDQQYKKEYTKSTINEKSMLVTKTTLELNKDDLTAITKNALTNIKNDEQLLKDIALLYNVSVNDIKTTLDQAISSVQFDDVTVTMTICTDITTLKFYNADIIIKTASGINTIHVEDTGSGYIIKANIPDVLEVTINTQTKIMRFIVKNDTSVLNVEINYNVTYSDSVDISPVMDAIDINELTESDIENITNNLFSNEIISNIMNNFMTNGDHDYDDDDDYNYNDDYNFDDDDDSNLDDLGEGIPTGIE